MMDQSKDQIPRTAPPAGEDAVQSASILVVDDSRVSAMKLAKAMQSLGLRPETAANGAEALRRLREQSFDLVLLDIVMPEMDGYAVLKALKSDKALRDIPVIVISSLDDEIGSVARAIKLGAVDFLPKDFELEILKARLDSSLANKRFRDRELAYFRDVERLTQAAQVIETGAFRPSELDIDELAARHDPLGRLALVFRGLAQEIYEREKRHDRTTRTLRGTLLVLISGGIFGIVPALGRMVGELGAPSLGVVFWANLVAAILCFAISAARGGIPRIRLAHLPFFLIWAVILGCLYQFATVVIAGHLEATMIALIGSSRGFMVFLLAAMIALERPSLRRFAGLGLGFMAVALVLMLRGTGEEAGAPIWLVAALGLPLLLAVHTLLMTWRPRDIDSFATVGIMMALSAALLLPITIASGEMYWPGPTLGEREVIILTLGVASGIAIALALDLVATAGAVFASQMAYSQTLAGIVWGILLLDEQLPALAWGAFGVVILGVWLVQPKQAGDEFSVTVPISRS
ncbi:MAG: response regulator [Sphingomonadales bacterium]|nr:MAG: response regulator [Sphingomonadales bacterium]